MRKTLKTLTLMAVVAAVAPACASRGFVRTEVAPVQDRVDALATSVDETRAQTEENGERIGEVDRRAGEATELARTAQNAADAAMTEAGRVDGRVDEVAARTAALSRLILEVTISEDQGEFSFGDAALPDQAKASLDQLVVDLQREPDNVFIEIEGHTDSTGPEAYNKMLGMERAEAVKQYLYEQHHVPLHKMNVISYGEDRPVAPNDTSEGRAQNRRVVIKVLS